jgi:hypothetical protein
VEVEETEVEPRLFGPGDAQDAVGIGLIVSAETSCLVNRLREFHDPGVVDPRVLGIGDEKGSRTF